MQLSSSLSAVVTGGASGLGGATAKALASKGVKVAIFDMNEAVGAKHAAEIGAKFYKVDVTNEPSVDAGFAAARKDNGIERILVNCAGIGVSKRIMKKNKETGALEPHDLATFTKVIQVNLIGTFLTIAKSAAAMATLSPVTPDGERGVIVNTASVAATDGQIGQVAYSASKGGVLGMTLPIARDLAQSGIRVNTILPGLFMTPMMAGLPPEASRKRHGLLERFLRLGTPAEYAMLACHICENGMLNGEAIRLDGALRMAPR
jgi:NAD(P)-dependent dehydrogenase (short-subunit alcohol dehydrogenase family)